jgi:hypothetical protein
MKTLGYILACAFLACAVAGANATELPAGDPQIKTGGGGLSPQSALASLAPEPVAITSINFEIESPSGTSPGTSSCFLIEGEMQFESPQCYFENEIQTNDQKYTIVGLTFEAFGVGEHALTCGFLPGSPFSSCGVDPIQGGAEASFDEGSIPYFGTFTLDFAGFSQNFVSPSVATVVSSPEPATAVLLLAGLALLWLGGRRRAGSGC